MKIRKGFVSNSSSTSFTCEICGESEYGYDSVPAEDYGFTYCVNGHEICTEHVNNYENIMSDAEDESVEETGDWDGNLPVKYCPICQFEALSMPVAANYLHIVYGVPKEEVFAKVKESNKRRKKLYDSEYVQYVCDQQNLNEDSILNELKEKFTNYTNFSSYLREAYDKGHRFED